MIPKNITEQHVLQAIQDIDANGIRYPLTKSRKFDLVFNGKTYPPKYTISLANEYANKVHLSHKAFNTDEAQNYLRGLSSNFVIEEKSDADPILEIVRKYKSRLSENRLSDEIYKWKLLAQYKGRPDVNIADFYSELKGIDYRNLIYPVGVSVIHHLAKDRTEPYRACFKVLFDETKPLEERLKWFTEETLTIYREIMPEEKFSHHQDERTMATFLTYFNPDKYSFFKDSFYQKYCKLIGIAAKKKGYKYLHYLELIDEFIVEYIQEDSELLDLISSIIPPDYFQDTNHRLLAQDILYETLDKQIGTQPNYWRIGTSDRKNNYWAYMKANSKVCIGWSEIGDLEEEEIKTKKDIEELLRNEGFYIDDNRTLSRKAGEIFNFYSQIKIGDIVLAQDGASVKGIGIVSDEYLYDEQAIFAHQKETDWKIIEPNLHNSDGLQTTVFKISDTETIKAITALLDTKSQESIQTKAPLAMAKTLNQILFGPPGTGKTYHTINKALEIIGEDIKGKTRKDVKVLFDTKMLDGQIVFTTFHQSMSYEDFIEGIKPVEPKQEGQHVAYKIIDGIFKRACAVAAYNCYRLFTKSQQQTDKYSFDDLHEAFIESIREQIDKGNPPVFKTLRGRDVQVKEINKNDSIIARAKNSVASSSAPLTKENLQKLYDRFKTIEEIEDLKQVQETVQITPRITEFYAVFAGLKQFEKIFKPDEQSFIENKEIEAIDVEEIQKKFNAGVYKESIKKFGKVAQPVVMIIDEINRGNVSQIFGELITLIEADKRLGMNEALEVDLPYSKLKFGVPPNLYIVGTMNTADRSVEALDAALRRRFSFEETLPKYDLKELNYQYAGIPVTAILETINKRIEKLLDKDHAIGHSYFILNDDEKPENKMPTAFYKNIIPLLQEYFFGDYGKIGMVLGKGFVHKKESNISENIFADFNQESAIDYEEKEVYEIINYSNPETKFNLTIKIGKEDRTIEMNFERAIKFLMRQDIE